MCVCVRVRVYLYENITGSPQTAIIGKVIACGDDVVL